MEMKEVLIQEIADLEQELKEIDEKIANAFDPAEGKLLTNDWNKVSNKLNEKKFELEQLSEQEDRTQKQAEHIDGILQQIIDLGMPDFLDRRPDEKIFEFDERKKEYSFFVRDFVKSHTEAIIKEFNGVIATKDERIKELNAQGLELNAHNLKLRGEINELQGIIENGKSENQSLVHDNGNLRDHIRTLNATIDQLTGQVGELTVALEQTQKPSEYKAPDQSLTDRASKLKSGRTWSEAAEQNYQRFLDRNKETLDLPDLREAAEPPHPFRSEDHSTNMGADQESHADEVEVSEEEYHSFQGESDQSTVEQSGSDGLLLSIPTEKRLEAVEADVKKIKAHLGL
jgi:chromosome segregation ATPase